MTMEELIQRIGRGKAAIDHGFSRVGPELQRSGPAELALFGAAGRIIRSANAVVLLCKHEHAEEARPVLRTMAASALVMRWLSAGNDPAGVPADLDAVWRDAAWRERLSGLGIPDAERRSMEQAFTEPKPVFDLEWASGLPWSHIAESKNGHAGPEAVLAAAFRVMELAVSALAARWPEAFVGIK